MISRARRWPLGVRSSVPDAADCPAAAKESRRNCVLIGRRNVDSLNHEEDL
jgi:hypothetical protein